MSINWENIRTYNESQDLAFEELCCQLARYESVPENSTFIRKGTPDAGVEGFWVLPNGEEWVWQAKFFRNSPNSSQWNQIDDSVRKALEKHPELTIFTLCLPIDRPDARIEGQTSCLEKWDEHVEKYKKWAAESKKSVEFVFWGSSEIIDRLSKDEHRGRIYFWFNKELFNNRWFREKVEEQIAAVGARYTPELNVEIPISQLFDGLGRTSRFYGRITEYCGKIARAYRKARRNKVECIKDDMDNLEKEMTPLLLNLKKIEVIDVEVIDWENINHLLTNSITIIEELLNKMQEFYDTNKKNPEKYREINQEINYTIYKIRELHHNLDELKHFTNSKEVQISNTPAALVIGEAGTGKTHLFSDIAILRTQEKLPTILLLGEHFTDEEPWKQILNLLSLTCSRDEFLGALEASAQAEGKKALILIDALNEGKGKTLWYKYLESFHKVLSRFKWISFAISVRTSYVETIIPESLTNEKLVNIFHKGFSGVEYDAVNSYFKYYGITLPSIPFLFPEFRNPLFLRIFCQGLSNLNLTKIPPDMKGITSVFNFYIYSINRKLSHPDKLDYNYKINYIDNALNQLAKRLTEIKARWIQIEEAEEIVNLILAREGYEQSLFRNMISEGILSEDVFRNEENEFVDGIHFVYERFSDFLIAKNLLNDNLDESNPKHSFSADEYLGEFFKDEWSCHINKGLIDSFAIQIPERIGIELLDAVPYAIEYSPVMDAFIQSLLWRNPDTINEHTDEIISNYVMGYKKPMYEFLEVILTISSNPIHRYNAHFLDDLLKRYCMADRDAWWSIFIHDSYQSNSAIDRLVDWARSFNDEGKIDDEPVFLSGITLSWFLSSSNRFLRDNTTKSLVRLFSQRIHLLEPLIRIFLDVDDPYVLERIFAVAYGSCLRSRDYKQVGDLAINVYNFIFESGNPIPHILLRDYARGIIETALLHNDTLDIDVKKIRPPYNSEWIEYPPTKNSIDKLFERDPTIPYEKIPVPERAKFLIYRSVMSSGDFERYVIGTNSYSFNWSNIPINETETEYDHSKHNFDLSLIQRWIVNRVFELGWTPEKFGNFDYWTDRMYNQGRSAHKVERIGKKYQWLAFHEILARISDNYRYVGDFWDEESQIFDGPWQMFYRNIDPSFLLSKIRSEYYANGETEWWIPFTNYNWESEQEDIKWIKKSDDLTDTQNYIEISNPEYGDPWFVLQAYYRFEQPVSIEEDRYETLRRYIHHHIIGHIVKKSELGELVEWVNTELPWDQAYSRLGQFYNVFMGELHRFPAYLYKTSKKMGYNDWNIEYPNCPKKIVNPCDLYEWESVTFDCSIDEHVSIYIPSRWFAEKMGLKWNSIEGQYIDANENLITFDTSVFYSGPGAFLVNRDKIVKFLDDNELGIFWLVRSEKSINYPLMHISENVGRLQIKEVFYFEDGEIKKLPKNINFIEGN